MAQDDHCFRRTDRHCEGRLHQNAWQEVPLSDSVPDEEDRIPSSVKVWVVKGEELWEVDLHYHDGEQDTHDFIRFVVDNADEQIAKSS